MRWVGGPTDGRKTAFRGRLHGAFSMCVSMSDKPFDAEACDMGGQASASNGLTDASGGLSDMKNAPCNRPLKLENKAQDGHTFCVHLMRFVFKCQMSIYL
jgi:hypothetical protein